MPKKKNQGLALYLLAELLKDQRNIERFIKRPRETAKRFDLSDEKVAILYTLEPREIARLVSTEARENVRRAVSKLWPLGEPFIDDFEPKQLTAKSTRFRVMGEGLMWDAQIVFDPIGTDGEAASFKAGDAEGPFVETTLEARVNLKPGTYTVAVLNRPKAELVRARGRLTVK